MSQLPNSAMTTGNAISMNPAPTILIGNQGLQPQQLGQLNATTMIQLPPNLNAAPTINASNIITNTNPNHPTTFILNPTTNVQGLQAQPQVHPPAQISINPSQINQMMLTTPQQTQQQLQQFQIQTQQQQVQVKQEQQLSNGNRLPNMFGESAVKTNGHDASHSAVNGLNEKPPTRNAQNLHPVVTLDKQRLQELVKEVDPNEQLEEEVEDVLLSIADDFIENLVCQSCIIAKHRKSGTLEVKDVQLALEKNWNMWIPGFGVDGVVGVQSGTAAGTAASASTKPKKSLATEAHKQRMALIKKNIKKF